MEELQNLRLSSSLENLILEYRKEKPLDTDSKEFKQAVAAVVVMFGIKQLPDKLTMAYINNYLNERAPKFSIREFILAFQLTAEGELPRVEHYNLFSLEFVSKVLRNYARVRSSINIRKTYVVKENQPLLPESSWLTTLLKLYHDYGHFPSAYNWRAVYDEMKIDADLNAVMDSIRKERRAKMQEPLEYAALQIEAMKKIVIEKLKSDEQYNH